MQRAEGKDSGFLGSKGGSWGNNALAQAHACGGSNCKGRGISQGLERSEAGVEGPLVCTNGAQRSAEDWGNPLRARGAELLRKGF